MTITTYFTKNFQNSSNITTATSTVTDTGLISVVDSVAGGGNVTVSVAYTAASVVAVYVWCDQDGTTMNPTAGASATLTFTDATIPYTWQVNDNSPSNSWSADFTAILITNGSMSDTCNFQIYIAYTV